MSHSSGLRLFCTSQLPNQGQLAAVALEAEGTRINYNEFLIPILIIILMAIVEMKMSSAPAAL